jgi:hypothetical protein
MPKDLFFNRGNPAMAHKNPGPSQMVVGFDEMGSLKSPSCSLPDPFCRQIGLKNSNQPPNSAANKDSP